MSISGKFQDLTLNETTVKVRLNDEKEIVEVNKLKLVESSSYFDNILSSKFSDHKKEVVEVKYEANIITFKSAMLFASTGNLSLDDENFLEILGIASYLQMEKLLKFCLNHFTSNLSRSNVESKYDILNETNFPVDEFKQSCLSFIKDISCGLYFIQKEPNEPIRSSLNFLSFDNHSFRKISGYLHNRSVDLNVYNFFSTLVVCPARLWYEASEQTMLYDKTMILYDLITEKTKEVALSFEFASVNCSNEKKLFVVSVLINSSEKKSFSLETFEIVSLADFSSTKKTIDYDLVQGYVFENFHYAECVDDKVYIFYQAKLEKDSLEGTYNSNNIRNYMMIICAKTLEIKKNINIAEDEQYHGDTIIKGSDLWKKMNHSSMYKSLNISKENNLFFYFHPRMHLDHYYFVFDVEKQLFYFKGDEYQQKIIHTRNECKFDRNSEVFSRGVEYFGLILTSWIESDSDEDSDDYCVKYRHFPVYNELRSYKIENDVLVEKEVIWKGEKSFVSWRRSFRNWVKVFSTVVVVNICLD